MRILPLLLVAAALPAQAVRLTNPTGFDFDGWWRVTLDTPPPYPAGWVTYGDPAYYVAGDGEAYEWPVDIRAAVPANTTHILNLAELAPVTRPVVRLADLGALYAGQPLINGLGVTYAIPELDGAGIAIRGHVAVAPDCLVVLACRWHPETPQHLAVTGRLVGDGPCPPLVLTWGDGQAWPRPDGWTVAWPRLFRDPADLQAAIATHTRALYAQQL